MSRKSKETADETTVVAEGAPELPPTPDLRFGPIQRNNKGQLTETGARQVLARGGVVLHQGQLVRDPKQVTSRVKDQQSEPTFGDDNHPLSYFEEMSLSEMRDVPGVTKKDSREIKRLLAERAEDVEGEESQSESTDEGGEGA